MGKVGTEQPLCACYKKCQEFHKVVDLKDAGLVVYCHTTHKEDVIQGGEVGSAIISTSQDVFILHNTKDVKILPSEIVPSLEQNDISCPRCKQIFEHAHELLQNITSIDKKNVMGVCDHCQLKAQFNKKPCYECKQIVKKFMLTRGEQKEDTKRYIKIWLKKMSHLFKDVATFDKTKKAKTRAYSELQIDRLCQYSSRLIREPEVKQMFHSESDTNLQTDNDRQNFYDQKLEKSVVFTEPVQISESNLAREGRSLGSDTTYGEPFEDYKESQKLSIKGNLESGGTRDQIYGYYDDTTKNINEAIKKDHDTNLRQMMRLQREIAAEKYEIPKIAPWEQQKPLDDDESIVDVQITTENGRYLNARHLTTPMSESIDPNSASRSFVKYESSIFLQKGLGESRRRKKAIYDSEEIPKKLIKREEQYLTDEDIKFQQKIPMYSHEKEKSGEQQIKRKKRIKLKEASEFKLKQNFSYFFPHGRYKEVNAMPTLGARSSQLIKSAQDKLRQQAEDKNNKLAESQREKLEENEKKRLARMENKQLVEEKKKAVDEQTKETADQNKFFEETQRKHQAQKELEKKRTSRDERKDLQQTKKQENTKEVHQRLTKKKKMISMSESELKDKMDKHFTDKKDLNLKAKSIDELVKHSEKPQKDFKPKRDFQGKRERDKTDEVWEKAKKEFKSQTEPRDKNIEVLEKSKKDLKSKTVSRDKNIEVPEKSQKDLKSKTEPRDKNIEVPEKSKKDLKSKTEPKVKSIEVPEKSKKDLKLKIEPRDKNIEVPEKLKNDLLMKLKTDKKHEVSEKVKKDIKSKAELRNKNDDLSETVKKDLNVKTERKDKIDVIPDKDKKDSKSKTESKLKMDKEAEKLQKELEKQERIEKSRRDQEEKDRLKQIAQIRKEKEANANKKPESPKETERTSKKKLEPTKQKETSSKKTKELSKASAALMSSAEKEEPFNKKLQSAKEEKEFYKILKDIAKREKEEQQERSKKQEPYKDAEEISKKQDSTKEKEFPPKGKEKLSTKKEEIPKVIEDSKQMSSKVTDVPKKPKDGMDEAQFRKLQADLKKEKEEELRKKKQHEIDQQKVRDLADKKVKEEVEQKLKNIREAKAEPKADPGRSLAVSKKAEESTIKELKINEVKMLRSSDDLILRLVKIRQTATGERIKVRPWDIDPAVIKSHKCHLKSGQTSLRCDLCNDSELEIDVESYDNKINIQNETAEIIIGEKIFKYKPPLLETIEEKEMVPLLFESIFKDACAPLQQEIVKVPEEVESGKKTILTSLLPTKDTKGTLGVEQETGKGIIRYALSDRTFIDKGWTMLPTEKVVRKMNVYRMRPAHPEFDWFEHNKNKRLMTYDSGEKLAEFDDNGRGRWYYKSGRLALDYYDAEETNAQQRFVIYSSGEPDERGRTHPITILATFDYLGNGIVFDHAGKIRLKYNQTEGVVLDRGIGPVSHWKWHTLNDPPVLQQVMIDTQMAHKDPEIIKLGTPADNKTRPDNEEMLAIEFDNFIKEKSKKLSQKFKPFQIKMKAMKINEHFSLKVLDQATIYLIFRDGSTNLKLNIGMILDHQEIVDTDTAEVGEVSNNLERFPARTDSLAGLQRSVAYAQRYERQRTERERRLRPPEPCRSADQITAAASPPLRPPLRTVPTGSTTSAGYCRCRKLSNNLYYNTRLL